MSELVAKEDGTVYRRLLESIEAEIVPLDSMPAPESRKLMIRHDVDHDMSAALAMARQEYQMGISATYMLLDTALYFDRSDSFKAEVKLLLDMGHAIGWHNNAVTCWLVTGKSMRQLIQSPLDFLHESGAVIKGTASHGDAMCKRAWYLNYEVWDECPYPIRNRFLNMPRFKLSDFDLSFEAYFIRRDVYLSDSGRKWRGGIFSDIGSFEEINLGGDCIEFQDKTIAKFNKMHAGVMQLLIHPCWWREKV